MKRDLDLVRLLLLEVEAADKEAPRDIKVLKFSDDEVNYHLALMIDAALIDGRISRTLGPGVPQVMVIKMTWGGHEYLDDVRSDTVWQKTKEKIGGAASSASVTVVREVAAAVIRTTLGL